MISVNVREFRKNLANYLALIDEEPVEIIKRDVVVAVLSKPNGVYTKKKEKNKVYTSKSVPKEIIEQIKPKGQCKVCGSGLKPGGDFCLGKGNHKQ